ncbi:20906_t:CDS:10, partial [Racocetra persica]
PGHISRYNSLTCSRDLVEDDNLLGYKRPLEKDDLYVLNDKRTAKIVTDNFEVEWQKETQQIAMGKKPSLLKALYRVLWAKFCLAGAYFANFNNGVQPPTYVGYVLIVVFFLVQMGEVITINFYFYCGMETGILSRTILITAIYRKALILSGKARCLFTSGKITNLMSTDTTHIDDLCAYFHYLWSAPFQICMALGLLIYNIGLSALAGFALLVMVGFIQGNVVPLLTRIRAKASGVTDERVKLTQEILLGIRVIKYYAWEDSFAAALNKLRNKEIGFIRSLLVIRSIIIGASMVAPVFASALSFITFSLTGADELSVLPEINPNEQYAIKVTDGEFIWESSPLEEIIDKSKKRKENKSKNYNKTDKNENVSSIIVDYEKAPASVDDVFDDSAALIPAEKVENSHQLSPKSHLHNINISIPRGKLIAIVGSVGSGKSSLLSALVGEMKRIKGEVIFGGNVGYCPQTAWIQNATIRDNITFGLPFDEEKYQRVIKDCCLKPDLNLLPAGDLTEIGEKGINLSGGQKQRVNIARAVYYDADIVLFDDPLSAVDAHSTTYYGWKIAEQGTYKELMKNGQTFSKFIAEYGEAENADEIKKDEELTLNEKESKKVRTTVLLKGLMSTEEQYRGAVNNEIYLAYIRNAGLDSVLKSSLYAHFSETLLGLPTIRAYREQGRFLRNNEAFLDIENRAYFLIMCVQRWLSIRIGIITNILIFFASLFAIIFRFNIVPSITGLALAYALQVTLNFILCVKQFTELETYMNSVERLIHYSDKLEVEAENIIPDNRSPPGWPARGEIHIKNLEIKYGPDSPLVLKGISVDIMAAEKIGIVGRTGRGKSTLAMSFFRIIEPTSGSILIDDVDISTIGLRDLRSNITIIPQDPVLFNGTIRSNLDPFNGHSDPELWDALHRVHLTKISSLTHEKQSKVILSISDQKNNKQEPIMLDSPVKENGSKFSQGQQQLIAMARALIRHSKLIIMDEATASIDFKTDHLIQATIREEFKNSTVITIAHRLRTVIDYDRILVMDAGNIVEFDIPYLLMQKSDGLFRGMCERSGEFAELIEIAKQKYE